MAARVYNLSTKGTKAGGFLLVENQPGLCIEFKTSLKYIARLHPKRKEQQRKQQQQKQINKMNQLNSKVKKKQKR